MLAGDLILTASAKSYENWACQPMLPGSRERVNPSLTSASLLLPSIKPSRQPMKNAQFPMARNFGGQCSGGSRNYDSGVSVFLGSNSRSQLLASIFNLNFMVRSGQVGSTKGLLATLAVWLSLSTLVPRSHTTIDAFKFKQIVVFSIPIKSSELKFHKISKVKINSNWFLFLQMKSRF